MHLQQEQQVKTKCVPANSQGRVSKQASICGGGKTGRRKKQQKSQRSQNDDRVTGLASKSSHSSPALRGPSSAFACRGKEKSTRACNVHTWQPPSKQVSRGRKEWGPCHKMPRSFTVKSTRRRRRREKTEEEKYKTVSGSGENKSSEWLHGCRLLLATATKLIRFLAPLFHRRTAHPCTHTHTLPLARSSRREGGASPPLVAS